MKVLILASSLMISSAFASVVGLSTHPFSEGSQVITTEFDSYISAGAGMGITAKFYNKINRQLNFDAGVGVNSGERENRVFAGVDYEIFPDYGRQARFSTKAIFETVAFDGDRVNSVAIAPTLSKGFSFWEREAFPFISLPVAVSLNSNENTYETNSAIAAGITSAFRLSNNRELVANFEANLGLRNSYTALVVGVSLPL